MSLQGQTLFITGASRGIGLALALRAARDGANVAVVSKTTEPHPSLPGTIYTAAEAIEQAGGKAIAVACDIRDDEQIANAVEQTVERFGGIDICVNNASAISLARTLALDPKRYDLMHDINARGTYMVSRACVPFLRQSANAHVLNMSPPLDLVPGWFAPYPAYAMAKYAMSMYAMAMAEEFREDGIAFNTLWPRTMIYTAAVRKLLSEAAALRSRTPEIMADAAWHILTQPARKVSGHHFIDDEVLIAHGVTDLRPYRAAAGSDDLQADLFVPEDWTPPAGILI